MAKDKAKTVEDARDFLAARSKTAAKRAEDDLQLWQQWHTGGRTPELLDPLLKRYDPVISRKVRDWSQGAVLVSPVAFKAEVQKQFINAAHSFDPERGIAFNTHVQNRLQKAQRFRSKNQNVGYIPEELSRHIGTFDAAHNELSESLGRAPTHEEISSHTGIPVRTINSLVAVRRKDVPASHYETDPSAFTTSREMDVVRLMQRRPGDYFTPDEAAVFQHVFGSGGARKITDTTGIARQLGMSLPKVSRLKTSIAAKIKSNL